MDFYPDQVSNFNVSNKLQTWKVRRKGSKTSLEPSYWLVSDLLFLLVYIPSLSQDLTARVASIYTYLSKYMSVNEERPCRYSLREMYFLWALRCQCRMCACVLAGFWRGLSPVLRSMNECGLGWTIAHENEWMSVDEWMLMRMNTFGWVWMSAGEDEQDWYSPVYSGRL